MTTYWHGGTQGRNPGDLILPRATTGIASARTINPDIIDRYGLARDWCRADKVYVTTRRHIAWYYATGFDFAGLIYRVEPTEPIAPDPASPATFTCPSARVVDFEIPDRLEWLSDTQRATLKRLEERIAAIRNFGRAAG